MQKGRFVQRFLARCRRSIVTLVIAICSAVLRFTGVTKWPFARAILFDSCPRGRLLLSQRSGEAFAVCTDDKAIGRAVYLTGSYDFAKIETVMHLLGGGRGYDLLIDIGANIGVICIPAVNRGLFKAAVAIEPDPRNFDLLQANIYLNGLAKKIAAHNIALGDKDGQMELLSLSRDNYGDHRIETTERVERGIFGEEFREIVKVRSETLDSVISLDPLRDTVIWMDTQGFEGFVLAGAPRALGSRVPVVAEFWPYGLKRSGSFGAMKAALQAAGYESFIDLSEPSTPIRLNADSLDALYNKIGESGQFTDILVR